MQHSDKEADYTLYTFMAIAFVVAIVTLFSLNVDLLGQSSKSSESFQSNSIFLLLFRLICFSIGVYAIYNMVICGPGTMVVVSLKEQREIILYPQGLEKFVTFSSWTLLANIAYFSVACLNQILELRNISIPEFLLQIQLIIFCFGISIAFLTATIVRHLILPNERKSGREIKHLFLFHEQIMHNFAAIFLAVELVALQPDLIPEFALFGLYFSILYILFAYIFGYFFSDYIAYSFLHPAPKIAPIFIIGLATIIALFYVGLWYSTTLPKIASVLIVLFWITSIVQFRPKHSE